MADPDPDPKPRPPEKPLSGDCCDRGCDCCVFTVYAEELEGYERRLTEWRERHPAALEISAVMSAKGGSP